MGFFSRKKKVVSGDASVVSALTTPSVAAVPSGDGSDISDDYVAPDFDAIMEEGQQQEGAEEEMDQEENVQEKEQENANEAGEGDETVKTAEEETQGTNGTDVSVGGPTAEEVANEPEPTIEQQPSAASSAKQAAEATESTTVASISKQIDLESIEDGYVNANVTDNADAAERGESSEQPPANIIEIEEQEVFNGVKGTVQPPRYRDGKYSMLFGLHFAGTGWWFADAFLQNMDGNNPSINTLGLLTFLIATSLISLILANIAFQQLPNHGETILKTTIVFSTAAALVVGTIGAVQGQNLFLTVCGFVAFVGCGVYMNAAWSRLSFTSVNLSVAVAAVRNNMGLVTASLGIAAVGFAWLFVAVIAGVNAYQNYGRWTLAYALFSYCWTHQVLTNVLTVATSGIIGRWFVIGEETPSLTTGLKETLTRARTYSFGSICFGSLFLGIVQIIQGINNFAWSKRVPLLPSILDKILTATKTIIDDVSEWSYVYVGLYGYSYTNAAKHVTTLFHNKGVDSIVKYQLASNAMLMVNATVGLLTGYCGHVFGTFEEHIDWSSGLGLGSSGDEFFVGFLVGFHMSSILLSVVSAAINTLVVCFQESPEEFRTNHPDLSLMMESAWKMKMDETISEI